MPLATMQELARYWATDYDRRKGEARLKAVPHFITKIDGLDIHFMHVRSKHKNAHVAQAQQPGVKRTDLSRHEAAAAALILPTSGSTHGAPLRETLTLAANEPIPNLPGKHLISHIVDYPPGASSAPHHHARSAFIYAYVLSGAIRSQVDGEPARVYRAGEAWIERPGAHHQVSANASDTEPARLLAVLIVDAADEELVIVDPQ